MPDDSMGPVEAEPLSALGILWDRVHFLETCGVVELAVINPSVMDYMRHWEGRAEKAEARITTLERELDEAQTLRHKAEYHAGVLEAQTVVLRREVERLRSLAETAFRDGLSYGMDVVVKDPDEAWRTSRVRAALNPGGGE